MHAFQLDSHDENPVDVLEYTQLQDFLVDMVNSLKTDRKHWSFGRWARELGIKHTATVTRIVHGQRIPGHRLTETLIQYFGFDGSRASHFRSLVAEARGID